jgi:hypothetical protein
MQQNYSGVYKPELFSNIPTHVGDLLSIENGGR